MSRKRTFTAKEAAEKILSSNTSSGSEFECSDISDSGDESRSPAPDDTGMLPAVSTPGQHPTGDQTWEWHRYDDLDDYYPQWLPEYQRHRGVLVDTADFAPVDYFQLFFPDSLFNLMETETNRYALQQLDSTNDLPLYSRFREWADTCQSELKAYVALIISMGLCSKPTIADYWSSYWLTKTQFGDVMPRRRFELLSSFLHFSNNEDQAERGSPNYNPLFKIQSMLDIVDPLYESVYTPGRCLSIDESIVKFKGRIFFRQYLPSKPTPWGLKEFVLCESKTGYHLKHVIYTGRKTFERDEGVPFTTQLVSLLLQGYKNMGHMVFLDNFYSSPDLFLLLKDSFGIGACGTVRINRKHMPHMLQPSVLRLKKGDNPVFTRCNEVVACAWHDTKRVHLLSTVHNDLTVDKKIRSKSETSGYRTVEKPVMAEVYNQNMNGVDILDQKLGSYMYPHKCSKWYHTSKEILWDINR